MAKQQEEGELILKLYELRREPVMRTARDWFFRDFNPQNMDDVTRAMFSEHSGHLRMVITYWDMAAALVLNEAIDMKMFNDTNGEHIGVFSKIEPLIEEIRAAYSPRFAQNLERLVDLTPDGRKLSAATRERWAKLAQQMATSTAK
ncbi:MAG: hypothetical protein P4M01_00655 [Acidobacteriota bacterium]|nr:hypothetical protein [Acidobacteriota bacterium]